MSPTVLLFLVSKAQSISPQAILLEVSQHALMWRLSWRQDALALVQGCDLSHRVLRPLGAIS